MAPQAVLSNSQMADTAFLSVTHMGRLILYSCNKRGMNSQFLEKEVVDSCLQGNFPDLREILLVFSWRWTLFKLLSVFFSCKLIFCSF